MNLHFFVLTFCTLLILSCSSTPDQKSLQQNDVDKDTLLIKIGDLFEEKDELLKVEILSDENKPLTSLKWDTTFKVIPKFNYDVKYTLVCLTGNLEITKKSDIEYIIQTPQKVREGHKEMCEIAFLSDQKRQTLIYKHRNVKEANEIEEWTNLVDTIAVLNYKIN